MINRIREQIELVYREYELSLAVNRARFDTGSDIVELGLAGAVAAVGGESLKTILGIALSGAQGTRLSISKNYFREKTTEIIITAMRGSRQDKLNQIIGKMEIPAEKYTFEEARADLVEFFYAGTLQGALQTLAADSGKKDADAKLDEKSNTEQRIEKIAAASEVEETDSKAVRDMYRALKRKNDVAEAQEAIAQLKQQGITINAPNGASAAQIYELINKELKKLLTNPDRETLLPKYREALEQAGKKSKPIVEEGPPGTPESETNGANSAGAFKCQVQPRNMLSMGF
jgi:hypothetical protein